MNSPMSKLNALGIKLPDVAVPAGAYVPALRTDNFVYTAGQLPIVDGKLAAKGKVGAEFGVDEAADMARISALNGLAAIHALVGLNAAKGLVKVVGFVASTPDFTDQPRVLNGASERLHKVFSDAGTHVRPPLALPRFRSTRPLKWNYSWNYMHKVAGRGLFHGPPSLVNPPRSEFFKLNGTNGS